VAVQHTSFCRLCEALCGITVTVEDGEVTAIKGDREHPASRGFLCAKGAAFVDVQNDPDRVLHPLRRRPNGSFERVSWDSALDDIADRMRSIIDRYGPDALGYYVGNPAAFAHAHMFWLKGLFDAIGASTHQYNTNSQDGGARLAASALLYGTPFAIPLPDLDRTQFLLALGANPLVSMGSAVSAPRIRERLDGIVARGGRVVVVDPRRTQTAHRYEHVAVRADEDAWLLLGMLRVILDEGLADLSCLDRQTTGLDGLRSLLRSADPARVEAQTGVPFHVVAELARAFASAPAAVAYGRTGACTNSFGTLVSWLIDVLNVVTGNLDRAGGAVFGWAPIKIDTMAERFGMATYDTRRSPHGGFPEVMGTIPTTELARAIEGDGSAHLRGLLVSAGNPVLSAPQGQRIAAAIPRLELSVSLDCYVNETGRHCDYVLPAATFLEREDLPLAFLGNQLTPLIQVTRPVVPPAGESREEWEVFEALARRLGLGAASGVAPVRWLARAGLRLTPHRVVDLLLRTSSSGDWFGARRRGLSWRRLLETPHGRVLRDAIPAGVLDEKIRTADGRVPLAPPAIAGEVRRLDNRRADDEFPLRLIGMRESTSLNSWLHNAARLAKHAAPRHALVHPDDAAAAGVVDDGVAVLESRRGRVEVPVHVTDDVMAGTVAYPHGWGHDAGWRLANQSVGAPINELTSDDPADVEALAGMSRLNGTPVRLRPRP